MRRFVPKSFYNITSFVGAALAAISFGMILFLMVLEYFAPNQKPYMGIITFVVLPIFFLLGLFTSLLGMVLERNRMKKEGAIEHRMPKINLNDPHHRSVFGFFSMLTIVILFFSAFGSYKAYEFTESVTFCGAICHGVMKPEYVAYMNSPHARVSCATCHVGEGADWYVKSKLSGAYQVYSTVFNKYNRPIETPVRNLRPAQETCEHCHWPKHFFAEKLVQKNYYLSDEQNSAWWISLLMRIGGGNAEAGPTSGIHWHMNINNRITYVAVDSQRQVIPWVQVQDPSGNIVTYTSTENNKSDEVAKVEKRRMDCIDCHNRPTHIYRTPNEAINEAMNLNWISPTLPSVKSIAIDALNNTYITEQGAVDSIGLFIRSRYTSRYPELAKTKKAEIDSVIDRVQKIYTRNFFPEMRVSWKYYPNNIGHLYYPGCFRCHDGKHVANNGKILSRDCSVCHIILAQKFKNAATRVSIDGLAYEHPVDIGDAWKEVNCSECHGPQ
jgi:nitrate/TMAO reductase-like tetraheme cytochrome c subunit